MTMTTPTTTKKKKKMFTIMMMMRKKTEENEGGMGGGGGGEEEEEEEEEKNRHKTIQQILDLVHTHTKKENGHLIMVLTIIHINLCRSLETLYLTQLQYNDTGVSIGLGLGILIDVSSSARHCFSMRGFLY